jgi:hypothetical protein
MLADLRHTGIPALVKQSELLAAAYYSAFIHVDSDAASIGTAEIHAIVKIGRWDFGFARGNRCVVDKYCWFTHV